jgi:Flp pilus assembly protein TadG
MPQNKSRCGERGANIVELAVIMTVLLLMVLGVIDFGRALYVKAEVANAARAGALYGSQGATNAADTAGITYAIKNESADLSGSITNISSSYTCQCVGGSTVTCGTGTCPGNTPLIGWVTVNCQVVYVPWLSVPYFNLKASYLIKGSAVMPVSGL